MDRTSQAIATYATSLTYEHLTPKAIHNVKRSFIDILGCAIGGSSGPPAVMATKLAQRVTSTTPSRILGTSDQSSPDMAAFANTVMAHYLNFDECWRELTYAGGFPGRTIPAILAVADPQRARGRDVITATIVAYEVSFRLLARINLHEAHWNQSFYTGPGAAAGLASVMRLTAEQTGNLLALTAVNLLRLRQTRAGRMPMWKAADCADANRDIVLYAYLAQEGMTGPEQAFDGKWGLWHQAGVTDAATRVADPQGGVGARPGTTVELMPFDLGDTNFKVNLMSQKLYPTHAHGIAPISMALQLRNELNGDEIVAIKIQAYNRAIFNVGGGQDKPERIDPQTREDADHSIPWVVAAALRDGTFGPASYAPESVRDPGLRPLMRRIQVTENLEFSRQYPKVHNMTMEIVTRSGRRLNAAVQYPKGYLQNPLTDAELESKFMSLAERTLGQARCREALDVLWRLETLDSVGPIFDALAPRRSRASA